MLVPFRLVSSSRREGAVECVFGLEALFLAVFFWLYLCYSVLADLTVGLGL